MMNETLLIQTRIFNELKTFLLIALMAILLGFLAYILAGGVLAFCVFSFIGMTYVLSPTMAPKFVMRFFRARPLEYMEAPHIHRLLRFLSSRAGLEQPPELYMIPMGSMAAFATGDSKKSAMAFSAGILNRLSPEEIAGIAAHEISHIKNNDMRGMWFALLVNRVTDFLSMAGQVLLFINLPLILFSQVRISWVPIVVLILAPLLSFLIQLGLSRINEFNADLGSAKLLGSPEPLISALSKIEYSQRGLFGYFFPQRHSPNGSSLFSTHPPTEERIRRLKAIRVEDQGRPVFF